MMYGMSQADDAARIPSRDNTATHYVVLRCLAILSGAAAVIHFAVAGEHFQEFWLFGVFMLVSAFLQSSWSILAVTRPFRLLLWAGVVGDGGIVVVYILTRTVGDLVGPMPDAVQPIGFGGGFCTVLEAIIVLACLWLLADEMPERPVSRRLLTIVPAVTAAGTAALLSVALVAGGPEMVTSASSMAAMPGMSMSGVAANVHLATSTPAGDITMPNPNMQMAPGMRMALPGDCTEAPTTAQQAAAVHLVDASWQDVSPYRSLAAALAAGYRPITPKGAAVVHYFNPAFYHKTLYGGPILNTVQPQSLVYANTPKGAVLAAAMFITSPLGAMPQPGGCLTQWHVHTNLCLHRGNVVAQANPTCPSGSVNHVTPPMMHVWFVPVPGGPTAVDATDGQIVKAAEQVSGPLNGPA